LRASVFRSKLYGKWRREKRRRDGGGYEAYGIRLGFSSFI